MTKILGVLALTLVSGATVCATQAHSQHLGKCDHGPVLNEFRADDENPRTPVFDQLAKENKAAIKRLETMASNADELRPADLKTLLEQVNRAVNQVRTRLDWLGVCPLPPASQNNMEKKDEHTQ